MKGVFSKRLLRDKVYKSGSLGIEEGIIFQETDQLVDNFSLDLSRQENRELQMKTQKNQISKFKCPQLSLKATLRLGEFGVFSLV